MADTNTISEFIEEEINTKIEKSRNEWIIKFLDISSGMIKNLVDLKHDEARIKRWTQDQLSENLEKIEKLKAHAFEVISLMRKEDIQKGIIESGAWYDEAKKLFEV